MKELLGQQMTIVVSQMKEKLKNFVEDTNNENHSSYKKSDP